MDVTLFVVIVAVLLTACLLAVFITLIISIRAEDRRMSLADPPRTSAEAISRRLLGAHTHHCPEADAYDERR
ncbi:hypothetical protein ACWENQ_43540 [Nonomuraea sp. NPDC004354]